MTTVLEIDVKTGQQIERPMTQQELAKREKRIAEQVLKEKEESHQAILKQLEAIDQRSIRALREGNAERIAELEAEADALREQLND